MNNPDEVNQCVLCVVSFHDTLLSLTASRIIRFTNGHHTKLVQFSKKGESWYLIFVEHNFDTIVKHNQDIIPKQ